MFDVDIKAVSLHTKTGGIHLGDSNKFLEKKSPHNISYCS